MSEPTNQAEHELISTALDVELLDTHLFRSKSLWLPIRARGVFGGQVISQALVSATQCVDPAFHLHSLHCYFMSSASPAVPILYQVDKLRSGRSYTTFAVKAVQNGKIPFVMLCSFAKPEPLQTISHQWPMPHVPNPDDCELDELKYTRMARKEGISEDMKLFYEDWAMERSRSPISIKTAKENVLSKDGTVSFLYWMKARNIPKYEAAFQKCILAYLSDLYLIGVGARIMGLGRLAGDGDNKHKLGMNSTVDHSIYFYNNDFDCGDWLLYAMVSPRSGSGRAIMHGRIHSQDGTLVAVTSQEGVVRAAVPKPEAAKL